MASSESTMTDLVVARVRTKYHWPAVQLNIWIFIMLVGSATNLGVFANFLTVQQDLKLGIPWYFSYWIAVGSLSLLFLIILLWLISQRQLLPGIVIMGSFILFVLWMVGLIVISVQLWGSGGVNNNCQMLTSIPAADEYQLAYLEENSICQSWTAAWAFELIGCIFLLWMIIMAYQVYRDM